jgi:hypothetical protein
LTLVGPRSQDWRDEVLGMPRSTGGFRQALLVLLVASLLLLPTRASAQSTGMVRGIVTDTSGSALAGVTVAVRGSAGGAGGRGAVSDKAGAFAIAGLPAPSECVLQFSLAGFATVALSEVEVNPGQVTSLNVALSPERAVRERIEVRANAQVVALADTTTQMRFSSEFIEDLPILGRNYQDVLALAPGVSDVDGDGNPNIHGARDTDVVTLVDGVSTTDPLTGKMGAQMNIDSIQEIEVKTSGATAEYGRAQGGFATIITKSGSNDFAGAFKFFLRTSKLDGDGAGIDDPSLHGGVGEQGLRGLRFADYLPFLSASGPISRDRAWYYVALEYISREEPVNAVNSAFVTGLREFRGFAKMTWQPGPPHRLALSINDDPQEFLNQGLNSFTREETGYTTHAGGINITLRDTSVLTPSVVVEGMLGHFESRPSTDPNLGPDTNGNGILYTAFNPNGVNPLSKRDPGDDWDRDGAWDVWEDTHIPNGQIDEWEVPDPSRGPFATKLVSEDVDFDGHLTRPGGCEGALREDIDCDGHLDNVNEDLNHNGILDGSEDLDGDHRLDLGIEDRNHDGILNDAPFETTTYPYGRVRPLGPDRDYYIDEGTGIISGPYFESTADTRRRDTVRADLGVFVPEFHGTHDLRTGFTVERESFSRQTQRNDIVARQPATDPVCGAEGGCIGGRPEALIDLMPTSRIVQGEAHGMTGALYVQDTWHPAPNVSLGLGLRFEREVVGAPGYSSFDPPSERAVFNRLTALSGTEIGQNDLLTGNRDGLENRGIVADPLFLGSTSVNQAIGPLLDALRLQAIRRMTRSAIDVAFTAGTLAGLFPNIFNNGVIDPDRLSELGVSVQQPGQFTITNNNLSPRLSASWDPRSDGRTKLFATWGRYYDKLFLSTVVGEQGPDVQALYYQFDPDGIDVALVNNLAVATPNHNVGAVMSKSPPSIRQVDRNLKTPYSDEFTVGFEREIAPELALAVRGIRRVFRDQLQDQDVNHVAIIDPVTGRFSDLLGNLTFVSARGQPPTQVRVPDGKPDLFINNLFFNQVLRVGNFNDARYTAIEVELRRRLARRWEFQASYVYSRAQGQAEDFQSRAGNDPSVTESEYGYLDFDQRHVVKLNGTVFLPGDWQMGAAASWSSGLPYSVISRFFAVDNASYSQFRTRFGYTLVESSGARFVSLPRNSERNAAVLDINLSARRSFVIGRNTAGISLEVFNLLNRDDLRIFTYEPSQAQGFDLGAQKSVSSPLQIDATRRFGRRFQIGFQIAF